MDYQVSTSVAECPNATTGENSEAMLVDSLTPESEEVELTTDYSIKLGDGKQVRKYQHELAEPGIKGENCIVVAPTGSGKTLVAALVISDHLQKNQHNANVVFMVNTRPLAEQQKKEIKRFIPNARVECSMGDGGPSVADLLPETDIIVCTAGKLLDSIKLGKVTFDQVSLIVIDECHHTKKGSPQANIMRRYLEHKAEDATSKVPQVIGLTASPGAGDNPDLDEKKTIDHLVNLCAHMDATRGIVTVKKHQEELDLCTNKPSFTLEVLQGRDPQEPFIRTIVCEMEKLEKHVSLKSAFSRWSQEYETQVQQQKVAVELSTNPDLRDRISTLRLICCYSQALNIYIDLRSNDAISVLQEYNGLPANDSQATTHELNLKENLRRLIISLKLLPPVENPLLKAAEEKLVDTFEYEIKSKGVFFVRTKRHTRSICEWIKSLPIASEFGICPRVLTGHTRETGTGLTQVAQEEVMESFRGKECNLLVATSVAEEGLDVPACNLVIRFQHVSNEISKTQITGRARAENSEGFTILSCDPKKQFKETKNEMLLRLMETCILQWFPTGEHLVTQIREQQKLIIKHHQQKIALRKKMILKEDRNDYQLKCKMCKVPACTGSDIYMVDNTNHHVVPSKDFHTKIVRRPHSDPQPMTEELVKTHKIHCKNCDADWGVMVTWPSKGHEFPVLKCKSFAFEARKVPRSVKKWSDAPFEVSDLSVWLELQNQEDDD